MRRRTVIIANVRELRFASDAVGYTERDGDEVEVRGSGRITAVEHQTNRRAQSATDPGREAN